MKIKPVKTAVIGAGMISQIYLQNLKNRFSIIDLVGISDKVEEKAISRAEEFGIKKMTNEEILSNDEIELVLNLTDAGSHFEVSKSILEAGKHCYSEKMMCITQREADELKKLCKEKNVMFSIAPDTFLGASQQTSRYLIDNGMIGEPLFANIILTRGYYMIKNDEDDKSRRYSVVRAGGGIPYDMGGYYLYQLFNLFGPVKKVCGFTDTRNQNRPYLNPNHSLFDENFYMDTPNNISAVLEFENGVRTTMYMSSEHKTTKHSFEVFGTEGNLSLGDPNFFDDKIVITNRNGSAEMPLMHPFSPNCRGIGAADMAWSLRLGRKPRISFEMGYHALEIINAVIECTKDMKVKELTTTFERPEPISTDYYDGESEERSLYV